MFCIGLLVAVRLFTTNSANNNNNNEQKLSQSMFASRADHMQVNCVQNKKQPDKSRNNRRERAHKLHIETMIKKG